MTWKTDAETYAYRRAWALANPEKIAEAQRRYTISHKQQIREKLERRLALQRQYLLVRLEAGCLDCGWRDVRALEFDHVPERGIKRFKMTDAAYTPWKSFMEEAAKCDVVCANCHAMRTYERNIAVGKVSFREVLVERST